MHNKQPSDVDLLQVNLSIVKDCENVIDLVGEAKQQKSNIFIKFSNHDVPIQMDKELEAVILEMLGKHYKCKKIVYVGRMKEGIGNIQKKEK